MTRAAVPPDDLLSLPANRRIVSEMFLKNVGPVLVKQVADILQKPGIPVMPLKGVLLQKLVYGDGAYRPIADVDVLVPEAKFPEAYAELRRAGFIDESWERGGWQVTLRNPSGPPLGIDLHRRISRTHRSRLTASGMFERGKIDHQLFGAPVVVPCPEDLLAHLLLHATLHWLNLGTLHRAQDFEAVASSLSLDADRCARHLADQGLLTHAALLLPLVAERKGGEFVTSLARHLLSPPRTRASAWLVRTLTARYPRPGHAARRLAGLVLAPSISHAITSAVLDRVVQPAGGGVAN